MRFRNKQERKPDETKPRKRRKLRFVGKLVFWSYLGVAAIGGITDDIANRYAPKKFDPMVERYVERLKEGDFAKKLEKRLIAHVARIKGIRPEELQGRITIRDKEWINRRISLLRYGENIRMVYTGADLVWNVGPAMFYTSTNPVVSRSVGLLAYPVVSTAQIFTWPYVAGVNTIAHDMEGSKHVFDKIFLFPLTKIQMMGDRDKMMHNYIKPVINHEIFHFVQRYKETPYRDHEIVSFLGDVLDDHKNPPHIKEFMHPTPDWINYWVKHADVGMINAVINDFFSYAPAPTPEGVKALR
jgi:hypothetical protein